MLRAILFFVVAMMVSSAGFSFDISDYPYESSFDAQFRNINDVQTILTSLDDKDLEVVFSALKRVGELNMVSAKARVQGLLASANPSANQGKDQQSADYKNIFYLAVLIIGNMGSTNDGEILANYFRDINRRDRIAMLCFLSSLGKLTMSKTALQSLNDYALSAYSGSDSSVVKELVDALASHKSRSSIPVLFRMQRKVGGMVYKEGERRIVMRDYIAQAVEKINTK
jgi:hypothetical protein